MSVIWLKVWSDLWDNKIRTILAVLSIAAGVFAVGTTFGMSDQLMAGLDKAHQASTPAHLSIYLIDEIDKTMADRLKNVDGVEDIELANHLVTIQYKLQPDEEWRVGELIMRQDYEDQSYQLQSLQAGQWPKRKAIGIERMSSRHFDLGLGETVYFKIGNRAKERRISGIIHHPIVEPPEFGGNAVFFTDIKGIEQFDLPKGKYNQILARVTPYSPDLVREVASELKDRLSKEGIGLGATLYIDPQKHWGRPMVKGITKVLQILAIVSLGSSVVLVFNTVMAIVTQQTNQIGILKAIGGTQGRIIKIYLAIILVYGVLSLLVALPLGAWLAFEATQYMLYLFNIDYTQFQVSSRALTWQATAALAVPLLAGLWPVLSGTAITVREAIASYGLGGNFGNNFLDVAIKNIGERLMSGPYAIALGNIFRRKGRLLLTQGVLILAGVMFLGVMSLSSSLRVTLDNIFARHHYDFVLGFDDEQRVDRVLRIAEQHPGIKSAEVWFGYGASLLKQGQRLREAGIGAELIGIPNGSDSYRPDKIIAGRWLQPQDGPTIVIDKHTADVNGIDLGDVVTLDLGPLKDKQWQVIGIYKNVFKETGGIVEIYANLDAVFQATKKHNQGNHMRVQVTPAYASDISTTMNQLKKMYEAKKIKVVEGITLPKIRGDANSQFAIVLNMLLLLAVLMALVGGIGLMGALSISVVERTREIGVMRAIGAKTGTLLGMFLMEGILQGVLSWLVAVPVSFFLGRPLAATLGQTMFEGTLDYQYNFTAVFFWLAIILLISIIASVVPARRATQVSVRESLAYV